MLELGLAPDLELTIFGAPIDTPPPTSAADVESHGAWTEFAFGVGWCTNWRARESLQIRISRVEWNKDLFERYLAFGKDGFALAILQGGKCFFSPSASISAFGSQGGIQRHLVLDVDRAKASLR